MSARLQGSAGGGLLAAWPVPRPQSWVEQVDQAQTEAARAAVRQSVSRGCPFGAESWQRETARQIGLTQTQRPRGRPNKLTTQSE